MLSTEGQQDRIKRIISENRKGGANSPHATILSQSELNRIRNAAVIKTQEEILQQKRLVEEQNEKAHALAMTKKQRMLEIEAERRQNVPPTEAEMEATMKNEALKAKARLLRNEDMDDVKQMNQMMLYAKVVTVRDRQLEEKSEIREQHKTAEKRKDLLMEVERLKKIKYHEENEKTVKEHQREAAHEIVVQIKEREMERLKEQEEREREGQDMLKYIKQLQKEETIANQIKKQQQKELLDTILESNQKAIKKKADKILEEKEEEEKIMRYNKEKTEKEAEYQAELKRLKDEKEKDVQRLRDKQEKASDRQSEIDALRAKRAAELADRQAREKERREAELKAKINQELLETRKLQSLEKERRLHEQAKSEKEEFQKIIASQKIRREQEVYSELEKQTRLQEHNQTLKKQIAIHEEKKKQDKREFLEEGKKVRDNLSHEKHALEMIKQEKLAELRNLGIEEKYAAELQKKKVAVL